MFQAESACHVFPTGISLQFCLRNRLPITVKAIRNGHFAIGGQPPRQLVGLVKSALAMPAMIKRHRNHAVPMRADRMPVKHLNDPLRQPRMLVVLLAVLEADDGLQDIPFGAVSCPRPFKVPAPVDAVAADEISVMFLQRGIGIAALTAVGRLDPRRFLGRAFRPREGQVQGALAPVSGKTEGCR